MITNDPAWNLVQTLMFHTWVSVLNFMQISHRTDLLRHFSKNQNVNLMVAENHCSQQDSPSVCHVCLYRNSGQLNNWNIFYIYNISVGPKCWNKWLTDWPAIPRATLLTRIKKASWTQLGCLFHVIYHNNLKIWKIFFSDDDCLLHYHLQFIY